MQNLELKKFTAEAVVSEIQSSDIYLTIKARLFDLQANLNGVRVTRDFMDEIIANESKYVGIPLYADIHGLIAKRPIGHMYNPRTGEFLWFLLPLRRRNNRRERMPYWLCQSDETQQNSLQSHRRFISGWKFKI